MIKSAQQKVNNALKASVQIFKMNTKTGRRPVLAYHKNVQKGRPLVQIMPLVKVLRIRNKLHT